MASAGERCPRGDGMSLASLMDKERTNNSIDMDSQPIIQQFMRRDGTPRRNNRSSTPNEQLPALSTASASAAANDIGSIQLLAESSSTRDFVQQAAATGTATDVLWEYPASVPITVQAVAEMLYRTAAEDAMP